MTKSSTCTATAIGSPQLLDVPKAAVALHKSMKKKDLLESYKLMLRMRRFEERAAQLYQQGQIGGFCHLYIGQEAIAAGCRAITIEGDDYITSYRCHAHSLACGVSANAVMAELTGRIDGVSRGKGGSMHMFSPKQSFWGGHGIVGAQVPLGVGLAFAQKYKGTKNICLTFIGDGAMNEGAVYEAFNMAALWSLPVIFVVENNQYGMGTSVNRAAAGDLYKRGEAFGIPGEKVNGMDFFSVAEALERAAKRVRKGEGPYLLEMNAYRYRGHSMSDPGKYRTRDEVDEWKEKLDPIERLQAVLAEKHGVKDAEFKKIDTDVKAEMKEVAEFAINSPEPDESELWTDVTKPGEAE